MPKMKKADKNLLDKIHGHYSTCEDFYSRDYKRNREDLKFALGDQWEEKIKKQRKKYKQPTLTENRLLPFALKTINEIRKARPTISVRPVDNEADVETADIISGLIRNIQYVSDAETAYDTSALNAIMSARGFIKIPTQYEAEDSFDQEIVIEYAHDPFKCYLDPSSKEMDGKDAEYYMEYEDLAQEDFKRQFPDADFEDSNNTGLDGWFQKDTVRILDYWYKSYETKTLYLYLDANGEKTTGYELPEGVEAIDERQTQVCNIKHCRVSGNQVLEKNDVIGKHLPVVPVYGLVMYKEGKREVYSLVHQAKDPQRMLNYWKSASAEVISQQPKSPWIGAEGSFAGNPQEWARANIENIPFLEYKPVELENGQIAPAPMRQPVPQGSMAMLQESAAASDGIEASLGVFAPSMGQVSNEVSGVAIANRQMQGDNATYHFVDNLVTSMRQVGKIIVDMIPAVYSEARTLRIIGEDGTSNLVGVNQPVVSQGKDMIPASYADDNVQEIDLEVGKYDVVVDISPSYATKRQETYEKLKELMLAVPQLAEAAPDLMVKSFDVQFADDIADRIRAVMNPALLGDDLEAERIKGMVAQIEELSAKLEQTEMALQVKDDNTRIENEIKMREVSIKEQEVRNDTLETQAKVRKMDMETTVEIPAEAGKDVAEAITKLEGQVADVTGALSMFLDAEQSMIGRQSKPQEGGI